MKNNKVILLSENSIVNGEIIHELDKLFEFTPPQELRKSLHYIFSSFLIHTPKDLYPVNFQKIAEDIYFLQSFLDKVIDEVQLKKGKCNETDP